MHLILLRREQIILYRIYPPLYYLLIAYSTIGTIVTIYFGKPLVKINRLQAKKEADFRFGLVSSAPCHGVDSAVISHALNFVLAAFPSTLAFLSFRCLRCTRLSFDGFTAWVSGPGPRER